jgi:predicted small integral membrane protein
MSRWGVAFGRFWYDFIVGDSIVLAVGAPVVLGLAWLFLRSSDAWAQVSLPLAVIITLLVSLPLRGE